MKKNIDTIFASCSFNARLLLKEMSKRGIKLTRIRRTHLVSATYHDHSELFYDLYSNMMSYTKGIVVDDKYHSKIFLQDKGFSINEGQVFLRMAIPSALNYAKILGFPVVIKPVMSSHGENVVMNINTVQELRAALTSFFSKYPKHTYCLVEKQFDGNEYRLFITKNNYFAAVQRVPASVRGDGEHTIRELISKENFKRMHPRNTCLCKIVIDAITKRELIRQQLRFSSVPAKNTVVRLRSNSNVSTGGNCFDVTSNVHPSFVSLAKKILKSLDIPFVGIDLLCRDISSKITTYAICETNSYPGISLHMMPEKGEKHDVAKGIIDCIFPETKKI
jgi:D-alanine-D-alanine ligase-like ATP-grasp enzyme